MRRASVNERPAGITRRTEERAAELARKAQRWADDNADAFDEADPAMPEHLINRERGKWLPLFAVAERLGGAWPAHVIADERALAAAVDVEAGERLSTALLRDLRDLRSTDKFADRDFGRTADIIAELTLMEHRPWAEMPRTNRAITMGEFWKLLRQYRARPAQKWARGNVVFKGLRWSDLDDAWQRYLTPDHAGVAASATDGDRDAADDARAARKETDRSAKPQDPPRRSWRDEELEHRRTIAEQRPARKASVDALRERLRRMNGKHPAP